jgi:hypothetical protein
VLLKVEIWAVLRHGMAGGVGAAALCGAARVCGGPAGAGTGKGGCQWVVLLPHWQPLRDLTGCHCDHSGGCSRAGFRVFDNSVRNCKAEYLLK